MDGIIGQPRAVRTLAAALGSGRLHHALIFHGPAGVGKFTTAAAFGRILLCHEPQIDLAGQVQACGSCVSCRLLDDPQAVHPDMHVVVKELAKFSDDRQLRERKLTTIPVEVLRTQFIEPVYRASHLQHNKVFIVDEADLLALVGQNAILKTLEEPPANTYLILVTANEERLLATVRSRCHRVAFVPLTDAMVEAWLAKQRGQISGEDRAWIVRFADGSIGRAELAAEYGLASWASAVLPAVEAMAQGRYPADLGAVMSELMDDFAKRWVAGHENASKEAANRHAAALMWSMIAGHVRRRVRQAAGQCAGAAVEDAEPLLEPWLAVIDALRESERALASNVNMSLVADHLVMLMHRALAPRQAA